jgi:hypothetical protein
MDIERAKYNGTLIFFFFFLLSSSPSWMEILDNVWNYTIQNFQQSTIQFKLFKWLLNWLNWIMYRENQEWNHFFFFSPICTMDGCIDDSAQRS